MPVTKLLIANRGEIAIRIARAAADMGLPTVAVHSEDDTASLHLRVTDEVQALKGQGAAAYLDMDQVIAVAIASGCDAIHPGYGFLAERADFAAACADAGLTFVGPTAKHLDLFGDKARARQAAAAASVPVIRGIDRACTLVDAKAFFASLGPGAPMIIKALAGGGGRGTRVVNALRLRGARGVRPRRALRRGAGSPRAPCRGADPRRPHRRNRAPGRAGMQRAAPLPEADRDRARARAG
jgi:acetyl/propionyl-CoA carboxylase alpha subunit